MQGIRNLAFAKHHRSASLELIAALDAAAHAAPNRTFSALQNRRR